VILFQDWNQALTQLCQTFFGNDLAK
jgi:hypothetical protein